MSSPLYIDYRDGSKELMNHTAVADIAEITTLEFGDAMVVGNGPDDTTVLVGVEVKSVYDLISSISSGRLAATQVPGLLRDYGQTWLLWFGSVRAGKDGRLEILSSKSGRYRPYALGNRDVPYGYLHSALFDFVNEGINVVHTSDEAEAAAWLAALHRWWSKPWRAHKGLRTLDHSKSASLMPGMDTKKRLLTSVASALPGIGFDRAFAAANHFETVSHMVNADAADWEQVPGIGKVIAKAVVNVIRNG